MTTPNRTLKEGALHELKEYLVISIYLWVIFGLFLLHKAVILNEERIGSLAKGFALINALALGKSNEGGIYEVRRKNCCG